MQKIMLVQYNDLDEVNEELSEGWKVLSVNQITASVGPITVYVVLEK